MSGHVPKADYNCVIKIHNLKR